MVKGGSEEKGRCLRPLFSAGSVAASRRSLGTSGRTVDPVPWLRNEETAANRAVFEKDSSLLGEGYLLIPIDVVFLFVK